MLLFGQLSANDKVHSEKEYVCGRQHLQLSHCGRVSGFGLSVLCLCLTEASSVPVNEFCIHTFSLI